MDCKEYDDFNIEFLSKEDITDIKEKLSKEDINVLKEKLKYLCKYRFSEEEFDRINSTNFFKVKNEDLNSKIKSLNSEILRLEKSRSSNKKLLEQKEKELVDIQNILKTSQERERLNDEKLDALEQWENRIKKSFEALNNVTGLNSEKHTLNCLFFIYCFLALFSFLGTIYLEYKLSNIIFNHPNISNITYIDYLYIIMPMPIAIAFVWGFIYQANRAQRQSVAISKIIHDIAYKEAILKATNNLTSNSQLKEERINKALEKLFDNHLNLNEDLNEDILKKEENKDVIPTDQVICLIKDLIKKDK